MPIDLNNDLVLKMKIDRKPVEKDNGKGFEWVEIVKADQKEYVIFDSNRDAPVGFGVKVRGTSKTYIVQKKYNGKVIKRSVGKVRDFQHISEARKKAREVIGEAIKEKASPNQTKSMRNAEALTLGDAFTKYRIHLTTRPNKKAKPNTLKDLDKYIKKFEDWTDIRIKDLTSTLIINRFNEVAEKHKTTAEQMFKSASTALKHTIALETHDASIAGRTPAITYNPFSILTTLQAYRTKAQLEADYEAKGVRNPLKVETQMALWLKAVWNKRNTNRLAGDFLLATTMLGTRRSEIKSVRWYESLRPEERMNTDYVDLKRRVIRLHDTKNRTPHEMPLADCMYEMFKQRKELTKGLKNGDYVFPARSKHSKTGHYTDSREAMRYTAKEAGFEKFSHHDLRRTFGRIVDGLGLPHTVVKQLLNHGEFSNPTRRYTEADFDRLRVEAQRIEDYIFGYAPEIYNALKPTNKAPVKVEASNEQ